MQLFLYKYAQHEQKKHTSDFWPLDRDFNP